MPRARSAACTSLAGVRVHESGEKARALMGDHRAHDAGRADVRADAAHPLEQVLRLDGVDHRLDRGARHRAAAKGRAEAVEGQRRVRPAADISSAAHGKAVAERLWPS